MRRFLFWLKIASAVVAFIAFSGLVLLQFTDPAKQAIPDPFDRIAERAWNHRFVIACVFVLVQSLLTGLVSILELVIESRPNVSKFKRILQYCPVEQFWF